VLSLLGHGRASRRKSAVKLGEKALALGIRHLRPPRDLGKAATTPEAQAGGRI
jgi:hypothetical protein